MKDKIVEAVCADLKKRSKVGIKKYGTTLDQNNTDDFLQHAYEEALDLANYLKKIQISKKSVLKIILKQHLNKLYEECKHGDEEHQKWLKDKFEDYLNKQLDASKIQKIT